jgi:hypothetical protein
MTRAEKVLGWVNRVRKAQGMSPIARLPKGRVMDMCDCPVARALGGAETVLLVSEFPSNFPIHRVEHPKYVQSFIQAFDAGRYPELEVQQ